MFLPFSESGPQIRIGKKWCEGLEAQSGLEEKHCLFQRQKDLVTIEPR